LCVQRADCAHMPNRNNVVSQCDTSFADAVAKAAEQLGRPEFYRLPKGSGGDPYFGFTRSYYYEGEARGYWKLARIRERGKLRGVTLVPYDTIAAFIRKQREAEA
jgi:hypothetical protein